MLISVECICVEPGNVLSTLATYKPIVYYETLNIYLEIKKLRNKEIKKYQILT